ncbi:MAG: hypothetical protein ABL970_01810 [Nitrospira sp.]
MTIKGEYSDNLTMTPLPHKDVLGYWTSPQMRVKGATEHFDLSGTVAADFVNYSGGQNISLTNLNFPLSMHYQTTHDTFGLDGAITRDNTLMGELQQTGLVLNFAQRNLRTVNPTWNHTITERMTLQTGYQYTDVAYSDGLRLGLVDYSTHTANSGISYQLTERDQLDAVGYFVDFSAPAGSLHSKFYGGQLSGKHRFGERLTATVSAGVRNIESSTSNTGGTYFREQELVWLYSADMVQQFERGSVAGICSRNINPSGFGLLIRTELCGLTLTFLATETLTLGLGGQVYWVNPIATQGSAAPFPSNRYFRVNPTVRWKVAENWLLSLSYSYAQRDIHSLDQQAHANGTMLMLTYTLPKLSVSR